VKVFSLDGTCHTRAVAAVVWALAHGKESKQVSVSKDDGFYPIMAIRVRVLTV
jgi:hypothetical protein